MTLCSSVVVHSDRQSDDPDSSPGRAIPFLPLKDLILIEYYFYGKLLYVVAQYYNSF